MLRALLGLVLPVASVRSRHASLGFTWRRFWATLGVAGLRQPCGSAPA